MSSLCLNFGIMKISKDNLTVSIVTLKSEIVVNKCIESIDNSIPIIVVENSKEIENNLGFVRIKRLQRLLV